MAKQSIIYLFISLVLLAGCGGGAAQETNQDVINRFKPQYAEMRTRLQQIAQKIPKQASAQKVTQSLTPQPKYTKQSGESANADILMYEQLLDPYVELSKNNLLDLGLANHLLRALGWTGEKNSMSASALKSKATDYVVGDLEQGLKTRYLVVARVTTYKPAVAVDKKTFSGGLAQVDGFLVDLESQAIVCSFTISAKPADQVSYQTKEGQDQAQELAKVANSTLADNARKEFIKSLNEMCKGDFVLK